MRGKTGKEHSQDYVKEPARGILDDQIRKLDPFSRERVESIIFLDKLMGQPIQRSEGGGHGEVSQEKEGRVQA
jgi:hypothetical protein